MRGIFGTIFLKDVYQIINFFLDCYQIKYGSNDYSQIHFFFLRAGVTIWGLGDFGKKILNLGLFKNFCWAKFPILEFF